MAKKIWILFFSLFSLLGIVLFLNQKEQSLSSKSCVLKLLADNTIETSAVVEHGNQIILKGSVDKQTKYKINNLSFETCGTIEIIDGLVLNENNTKHQSWLQFEVDDVNELVSIHGKVKNQKQMKEVLTLFKENFPNKTIAHDLEIDVLINRKNSIISHLTYLLPSIKPIKVAQINLTENSIKLEGLVRDRKRQDGVINTLNLIFANEVKIENNLETVIKDKNAIKSLEFDLPPIPLPEKNPNQ